MTERFLWIEVGDKVAEVGMGIETAKITLAQVHQEVGPLAALACIPEFQGLDDRVAVVICRALNGKNLFHFIGESRSMRNDRFGPFFNQFVFLNPVVIGGIPFPKFFETQRNETKGIRIKFHRFDVSGEIRMTGIVPLFFRSNNDDLTWNGQIMTGGSQGNCPIAAEDPATRCNSFPRENHQIDG